MTTRTLAVTLVALTLSISTAQAQWYLHGICADLGDQAQCPESVYSGVRNLGEWHTTDISVDDAARMQCGHVETGISSDTPALTLTIEEGTDVDMVAVFREAITGATDLDGDSDYHGFAQAYLSPFYDVVADPNAQGSWTKIYSNGRISDDDAIEKGTCENLRVESPDPSGALGKQCANDEVMVDSFGWWASDQMRIDQGAVRFKLPWQTPAGKYILRAELLMNKVRKHASAKAHVGCIAVEVKQKNEATQPLSGEIQIPQAYEGHPFLQQDDQRLQDTFDAPPGGLQVWPSHATATGKMELKRDVPAASSTGATSPAITAVGHGLINGRSPEEHDEFIEKRFVDKVQRMQKRSIEGTTGDSSSAEDLPPVTLVGHPMVNLP